MESLDDNFAWTCASSDSAGDSDTMAVDKMNDSSLEEESESGKNYKKKLQKQLFQERESPPRAARVKREPDSDDGAGGGARRRRASRGPSREPDSRDDASAERDDSYLALRVKLELEQASFAAPSPVERKRKRSQHNSDSASHLDTASNESESSGAANPRKSKKRKKDSELGGSINESENNTNLSYIKNESCDSTPIKKKKSKKSRHSESTERYKLDDMIIEDKFSAEETVVEARVKAPKRNVSTVLNGTDNVRMSQSKDIKSCNVKSDITYSSKEFISDESSSDDDAGDRNKSKTVDPLLPSLNGSRCDSEASDCQTTVTPALGRSHRALKISDRIQFEDDTMDMDMSETADERAGAESARVRRYLRARRHLRALRPRAAHHSHLTDDDEVWVLKCPHDLDVTTLTGTDVSLDTDAKCKIKIDGQTYNGSVDDENSRIALLTMEHSKLVIKNVPVMGTVRFRKRIPKAHFMNDNCIQNNQTNFIPLPETKLRHPLFGPDYKRAMKIPTSVKARLKSAEVVSPSPCIEKKKKKKHKKEQRDPVEMEPARPERSPSPHMKKRKHKHTDTEEPAPKKKRIKQESADNWDSEKAIEENLFNF